MVNPKSQYYQIPNKSQIPNPKQRKVYNLRERSFQFSLRILDIAEMLPSTKVNEIIRNQLVKSGTSIGANIEEGDGSKTKKDFLNKFVIARKEAKETKYWLKIISNKIINEQQIKDDITEAQELINILSSIINKSYNK